MRTFQKDSYEYENHMTPQGVVVSFYQGYAQSDDEDVCAYLSKLKGVKEVTDPKVAVPQIPDRTQSFNVSTGSLNSTDSVLTPNELLQRAVATKSK